MYFQLEIDYSLMKLTKINIQLSVNSINKKQLKDRKLKIRLSRALYLQRQRFILFFLDLKVLLFLDLLDISPANHIFLKTFNSEYNEINVWFTDQNSRPLEKEGRKNITMVIK